MEGEVGVDTIKKGVNMGADNYSNASSRLITLQSRKQMLEELIAQKNQELRELCIQEAQLTSVMPPEVPLEPGETLPTTRRKVGTAFEYPPNLINKLSNEKESITALETEIQFQREILENAARMASDSVSVKEKRKNTLIIEQTKHAIKNLEDRLQNLKIQTYGPEAVKHKKKPRPPVKYDTTSLKNNNYGSHVEEVNKNYVLHHTYPYQNEINHPPEMEPDRYIANRPHVIHHNYPPEPNPQRINYHRSDYGIAYTLDRLPPNTYSGVKERRGSGCSSSSSYTPQNTYTNSHPTQNLYQTQYSHTLPLNSHMAHNHVSPSLLHVGSQPVQYHSPIALSQPNLTYSISPHGPHPMHSPHSQHIVHPSSPLRIKTMENEHRRIMPEPHINGYPQEAYYSPHYAHTIHSPPHDKMYPVDHSSPHENYNTMPVSHVYHEPEMMSTGLGGYWVKNENNESIWVTTHSPLGTPSHWQRDKRFGSLDRRKDKLLHNKHLPPVEARKTPVMPSPHPEPIHMPPNPQIRSTSSQDKPLVRTQSLGSVGAQTIDIPWPNDDNSSCDSDGHSFRDRNTYSRRSKPKGWCETSLDGPAISPESISLSNLVLEEPIYTPPSRMSYTSPQTPKVLEIPAESNPSPIQETNLEIFNNNALMDLPKNCTVVQAGQYRPYKEVTKPFEMEDFYKYSTKFREKKAKENSEQLARQENDKNKAMTEGNVYENPNDLDVPGMVQKSIYQPLQPMKCQPYGPPK